MEKRGNSGLAFFSYKGTNILSWGFPLMTSCDFNYLPKSLPHNSIMLEIRADIYTWVEETQHFVHDSYQEELMNSDLSLLPILSDITFAIGKINGYVLLFIWKALSFEIYSQPY